MWWAMAAFNRWPLYAVIVRFVAPGMLPGGVNLTLASGSPGVFVPITGAATPYVHSNGGVPESMAQDAPPPPPAVPLLSFGRTPSSPLAGPSPAASPAPAGASSGAGGGSWFPCSLSSLCRRRADAEAAALSGERVSQGANGTYFVLRSQSAGMGSLAAPYLALVRALSGHYSPAALNRALLMGKYAPGLGSDFGPWGSDSASAPPSLREVWRLLCGLRDSYIDSLLACGRRA